MAPKRKAPAANARPSKRVASGAGTPISIVSDEEYDQSEDYDSEEREAPQKYDSEWHCTCVLRTVCL
jgi:hypothetical protein